MSAAVMAETSCGGVSSFPVECEFLEILKYISLGWFAFKCVYVCALMHLSGRLKKCTWRQSGYSGRKDKIKLSVWGGGNISLSLLKKGNNSWMPGSKNIFNK